MRTPAKLASFGAVLAIALGGGAGLGAAAGPIDVTGSDEHDDTHPATEVATAETPPAAAATDAAAAAGSADSDAGLPGGLTVAQAGYRLVPATSSVAAGRPSDLSFRVVDDAGAAVTGFEEEHERPLHLIVVDRDLVDYAHLHPALGDDGTWTVGLPALAPGPYRAFADFRPTGGEALTLGVDLTVAGAATDTALPPPSDEATVDGYDVALDGAATSGESELGFTVSRHGETVRTDPYLGAAGHLVAIRDGDLAYLHVHPLDGAGDEVRFAAEFPSAGTYRLFLDFSHGGEVRTAAFTVTVPDAGAEPGPAAPAPHDETGHDDGH
jgi:hypothetical protein